MPSIKTLKTLMSRPSIDQQYQALLTAISDRERSRMDVPAIKRRLGDKREEYRANEGKQVNLNYALLGCQENPRWAGKERDTRAEMDELRRANEAMASEIAADEKTLGEIASAALPEVSPAVFGYHKKRIAEAEAAAAKIAAALDAARGELANLATAPNLSDELRRELAAALSGKALGIVTHEAIDAIEARLSQAEAVTTTEKATAQRIQTTVTGLEQRLSQAEAELAGLASATPLLQSECLAPEVSQAEARYREVLAALVAASDEYRALSHIMATIRPEYTPAPLPEASQAIKDPGQPRLAKAIERERQRLSALLA